MGWPSGGGSLVCTDKRGEDAVLLAQELLGLVKLEQCDTRQDQHQVRTQGGVHAVLGGQEKLSGWRGQGWGS